MASAYRSALSTQFDAGSISGESATDNDSSSTLRGNSPPRSMGGNADKSMRNALKTSRPSDLPLELRNRVLMLTSRGVSYRHRHLLNDLHSLLPHSYKDTKLDTKSSNNYNAVLSALADLHSCNYVFFLEARKHGQDLYLWLARAPNGPTIKFSVTNIHTMGELSFGGNCLKGGRGIVVFDKSFEDNTEGLEYKSLIREMLRGVFCVPIKRARGLKPFVDRVIGIYGLDGKIWIRVYEIRETSQAHSQNTKDGPGIALVEIGPRFVLTPVIILEAAFGGAKIFENKSYVSGNQLRSWNRAQKAKKLARRDIRAGERISRKRDLGISQDSGEINQVDDAVVFG